MNEESEYMKYVQKYCDNCIERSGCDLIPIEADGSILYNFNHICRDFEEVRNGNK